MRCIFSSEMANGGRPLFPGNDIDDQLRRIFKYPLMKFEPFSFSYWYRSSFLTLLGKYFANQAFFTSSRGLLLCTEIIKAWEMRFCLFQTLQSNPYSSLFCLPTPSPHPPRHYNRPDEPNKATIKSEEPKCAIFCSLGRLGLQLFLLSIARRVCHFAL